VPYTTQFPYFMSDSLLLASSHPSVSSPEHSESKYDSPPPKLQNGRQVTTFWLDFLYFNDFLSAIRPE